MGCTVGVYRCEVGPKKIIRVGGNKRMHVHGASGGTHVVSTCSEQVETVHLTHSDDRNRTHMIGWGNETDRTSKRKHRSLHVRAGGQHKVFEVVLQRLPCRLPRVRQQWAKDRAAPKIERNRGADGTSRWMIVSKLMALLARISFRVGLMQYHLQDVTCRQRSC